MAPSRVAPPPYVGQRDGSASGNAMEHSSEALDGIERRVLQGGFAEPQQIPAFMDDRFYIRIPAYPLYFLRSHVVLSYYIISATFVLLAFTLTRSSWSVSTIFFLDYVTTYWFSLLLELAAEEILRLNLYFGSGFARLVTTYVLSNMVIFMLAMVALFDGQPDLWPTLATGCIMYNLLFTMGIALIAGGVHGDVQTYNRTATMKLAHLLFVSVFMLILLATANADIFPDLPDHFDRIISIAVAVTTVILYFCYFVFRNYSHRYLYERTEEAQERGDGEASSQVFGSISSWICSILSIYMVLVGSQRIVVSLETLGRQTDIPMGFIVFTLLPALAHPLDIFQAASKARDGDIEFAINLTLETSIGILAFLNPVFAMIGLLFFNPSVLVWGGLHVIYVMVVGMFVNSHTLANGQARWFSGVACIALYLTFALAFYKYTDYLDI